MARPKTYVTKSEMAGILGLSRGRVTQLIAQGLPVRTDGKVDRVAAEQWYRNSVRQLPYKPGPRAKTQKPKPEPQLVPAGAVEGVSTAVARVRAWRDLFETLIRESGRVPWILAGMGVRDPVALSIAAETFCDLLFLLADAESSVAYDWAADDDRSETPTVDLAAIAKKYRFTYDPEAVKSAAEQAVNIFDEKFFFNHQGV